jgi:hypothetical protein
MFIMARSRCFPAKTSEDCFVAKTAADRHLLPLVHSSECDPRCRLKSLHYSSWHLHIKATVGVPSKGIGYSEESHREENDPTCKPRICNSIDNQS